MKIIQTVTCEFSEKECKDILIFIREKLDLENKLNIQNEYSEHDTVNKLKRDLELKLDYKLLPRVNKDQGRPKKCEK